jgi:hypothetical protein
MRLRTPALWLGAGFALLGCGSKPAANDKKPVEVANKAATTPAPQDKAASQPATAPAAASTCRVLVDLSSDKDGAYWVADINLGAAPTAEVGQGSVLRVGTDTYALQLARTEEITTGPHGKFSGTWDDLVLTKIPGGTPATLTDHQIEAVLPEEDAAMNEYDTNQTLLLTGLVGPYVSFLGGEGGFTGGAHEFDDSRYSTISIPGGQASELSFFDEVKPNLEARLVQEDSRRKADGSASEDETLPRPENLKNFGLGLGDEQGTLGLRLLHNLDCCSWAENHNKLALDVPLPKVPGPLQAHLAISSDGAWVEAPDGCGAVSFREHKLQVRAGKDGASQAVALPGVSSDASPLGFYWIPPADPFKVAQLPKPITPVKKENASK